MTLPAESQLTTDTNAYAEIFLPEGEGNIWHSEHNGNNRNYKSVVFSQNPDLRHFPIHKLSE